MTIARLPAPIAWFPRGGAGLVCNNDGVALGPMRLVDSATDASGRRVYRLRPAAEVAQALRLAYGSAPDEIERCQRGLAHIAQLMTAGERAQACIQAVQLACPEVLPDAMAKLAQAALHALTVCFGSRSRPALACRRERPGGTTEAAAAEG